MIEVSREALLFIINQVAGPCDFFINETNDYFSFRNDDGEQIAQGGLGVNKTLLVNEKYRHAARIFTETTPQQFARINATRQDFNCAWDELIFSGSSPITGLPEGWVMVTYGGKITCGISPEGESHS